MKSRNVILAATVAVVTVLIIPTVLSAQDGAAKGKKAKHHHYKLIVLGTLGGPQSYGDAGHNAGNITNQGMAVGVADTATRDPFFPNYNPGFAGLIGQYPFIYHAFVTNGGAPVDLGGLPGGTSSEVSFITQNGLISGQALNGSLDPLTGWPEENAVLWKDGQIINLGTVGGNESAGGRVNSRGQVTGIAANTIPDPFSFIYLGYVSNGGQTRAFLWDQRSGMQDIGTLGGPDAFAPLINERGQIAGFSYVNYNPSSNCFFPLTTHPFLWENGRMQDIGLGGSCGLTDDLNNRGQVVGLSNVIGDAATHAFLWDNGTAADLGTLGGTYGEATTINEAGEIAGVANLPGDQITHAFFRKRGFMTDLGTLEGDCFSGAFGINGRSQVVGQSITCDFSGFRAFLWENGNMLDLNQFVPVGTEITLTEVEQINDRGEMFGIGTLASGEDRAFLLIPCDDNHPDVEGCDYSMVDAAEVPSNAAVPQFPLATLPTIDSIVRTTNPWQNWFRQRYRMLGQRPVLRH